MPSAPRKEALSGEADERWPDHGARVAGRCDPGDRGAGGDSACDFAQSDKRPEAFTGLLDGGRPSQYHARA